MKMSELTVFLEGKHYTASFEGTPLLREVLSVNGLYPPQPCGGNGRCGKCRVMAEGAVSEPNDSEIRAGCRLACQIRLLGDAVVRFVQEENGFRIETDAESCVPLGKAMPGQIGAAVDIGTTTLVLKLFSLESGAILSTETMPNPQRAAAADVMGRISAAMSGRLEELQSQIREAILLMLDKACAKADAASADVKSIVVTGNTTMLYLFAGKDPGSLSHAPFEMDDAFGRYEQFFGKQVFLPRCMHSFVGADITCAILATGLCGKEHTALLCDIGTNGEIALWKNRKLYITSTAAGPAFEGAGISCGCGSIEGAIDAVCVAGGHAETHTIGDKEAKGLCGSGLIDAVAAFLELEEIDETGACEEDELALSAGVKLLPRDIRALQLAKAAIAAGIQTLLEVSGTSPEEIQEFFIAGGFGSHLNVKSAVRIGLFPEELAGHARSVGNAALAGAAMLLLDTERIHQSEKIAAMAQHVDLGGNPKFNENYIECMMFPES